MLQEFFSYLQEQVDNGSVYVLGAQGQTGDDITESWIKVREHYISKNYTRAINHWKSQIDKGYAALRAYDCSGLGMYWLYNKKKLYSGDLNAHGMYGQCDPITRKELKPGDWVFRKNSLGRKYHVGYVVDGELNVIECKGRDDGVVKRSLDASGSTYWNCYGRPKIFKAEDTDMLKKGDSGELVGKWQADLLAVGYELPKYGVDQDFGTETETATNKFKSYAGLEQNGIVDGETWAAMVDMRADVVKGDLVAENERLKKELTRHIKLLAQAGR